MEKELLKQLKYSNLEEFGRALELVETAPEGQYYDVGNFVRLIRLFQNNDMDLLVPITGFKGTGKTTLALLIARTYLKLYYPQIDFVKKLEDFVVFTAEGIKKNILDEEKEYLPLVADEAVMFMLGEDWGKTQSRELKKIFTQARIKHRVIFPCIPEFWWIDSKYREGMVLFWIHVVARGKALVFTPDIKIGSIDKWHRKEFERVTGINIFSSPEKIINIYRHHPCFFDVMNFPKINQETYGKYMQLREEALIKTKEETEG